MICSGYEYETLMGLLFVLRRTGGYFGRRHAEHEEESSRLVRK